MLIVQIALGIVLGFIILGLIQTEWFWRGLGILFLILIGLAILIATVTTIGGHSGSSSSATSNYLDNKRTTPATASTETEGIDNPRVAIIAGILMLLGLLGFVALDMTTGNPARITLNFKKKLKKLSDYLFHRRK